MFKRFRLGGGFGFVKRERGSGGASIDSDASAFMTATGVPNDATILYGGTAQEITGAAIWSAIDDFVKGLKIDNLWTKSDGIYPNVGGTAAAHKLNLKNPADTNGAFRKVYGGTVTHSRTGELPNGTTGYANSFWVAPSLTSVGLSVYVRNHTAGRAGELACSYNNAGQILQVYLDTTNQIIADAFANPGGRSTSSAVNPMIGLISLNRTSNTSQFIHRNGAAISAENTGAQGALPTVPVFFGAGNLNGAPGLFNNQEMALQRVGAGHTTAEEALFYARVQSLMVALKRQV